MIFILSTVSSFISGHWFISVLKVPITFFMTYELVNEWKSYLKVKKVLLKNQFPGKEELFIFLSVLAGSLITYFLNHDLALGAVMASSIIGISASILLKKYQVPIYCGSFAGMVSSTVISSYPGIIIVGIFAGILFILSKDVFKGFGGKLGATAFFGTAVSAVLFGTITSTMSSAEIAMNYQLVIYFFIGAVGTFLLRDRLKLSVVLCSAMLGLLGAVFLPLIYGEAGALLAVGMFCGTFVGMSSIERLYSLKGVMFASILGAVVFSYTQPYFIGLGGKLGLIAFGSAIATAGFFNFIERHKNNL